MNKRIYVRTHGQITLPINLRRFFHIERGDVVEVEKTKRGILLKPRKTIDSTQAYFWTKEWQEEERKVDEDYKAGRYKTFESVKAFLEDLDK